MSIVTIVPSKNRAAQLDLFIRSAKQNFDVSDIKVVYKATNDLFDKAYKEIIKIHNDVEFIKEFGPIRGHIQYVLEDYNYDFINFCTDDTVYYRPSNLTTIEVEKLVTEDVCAFIPRLGLNTIVQDYTTGELQAPLHNYRKVGPFIKYDWINHNPLLNYYYPATQDSSVMSMSFFKKIANFNWEGLRSLEGTLALDRRSAMYDKPFLVIPEKSYCVNVPVNAVQGGLYCSDNVFQSVETMNEKFLQGGRLSLDKSDFSNIIGCHQEVKLEWDNE